MRSRGKEAQLNSCPQLPQVKLSCLTWLANLSAAGILSPFRSHHLSDTSEQIKACALNTQQRDECHMQHPSSHDAGFHDHAAKMQVVAADVCRRETGMLLLCCCHHFHYSPHLGLQHLLLQAGKQRRAWICRRRMQSFKVL